MPWYKSRGPCRCSVHLPRHGSDNSAAQLWEGGLPGQALAPTLLQPLVRRTPGGAVVLRAAHAGHPGRRAAGEDVVDTLASLLWDWVRAKAGVDRKSVLFHDDTRATLKTLE